MTNLKSRKQYIEYRYNNPFWLTLLDNIIHTILIQINQHYILQESIQIKLYFVASVCI